MLRVITWSLVVERENGWAFSRQKEISDENLLFNPGNELRFVPSRRIKFLIAMIENFVVDLQLN
jgi:hypothetical protein